MHRSLRGSGPRSVPILLSLLAGSVLVIATLRGPVWRSGSAASLDAPPDRAACPVCGMFVARYPAWIARIVSDDGPTLYFDGCKDMFRYLADPARYGAQQPADRTAAVLVTSYYDQEAIEAREAFFVAGSDVLGPMGNELIPLRDLAEAEAFMDDHRGATILRFGDVDAEVLASLR